MTKPDLDREMSLIGKILGKIEAIGLFHESTIRLILHHDRQAWYLTDNIYILSCRNEYFAELGQILAQTKVRFFTLVAVGFLLKVNRKELLRHLHVKGCLEVSGIVRLDTIMFSVVGLG